MKTILVATDYSGAADNAVEYAAAFARQCKSKVVLFNAFYQAAPASSMSSSVFEVQEQMAQNKARLKQMAADISNTYGIQVECVSISGSFREELDNVVSRFEAGLVVTGVQTGSFSSSVFGNTITAIIRQASYPVLAVPDGARFQGIDKILFACDYNSLQARNELTLLQNLSHTFNASVQVFHVNQEGDAPLVPVGSAEENSSLDYLFKGMKHSYKNIEAEDLLEGIAQGVHEYGADLLTIIPNKTNFLDLLLNLSNTRKVVLQTDVPLLTIPNPLGETKAFSEKGL